MKKVSVVIPNWQGKHLLEKNLPKVLSIGADEVIVVDDGSTDGSVEFLNVKFPTVNLIIHPQNEGFVKSVNDGVKAAKGDLIVLLNTDVTPDKNLIKGFIEHFNDDEVFAVTFNNHPVLTYALGYFSKGLVEHGNGRGEKNTHISFWASGGNAAYSRKKWLQLGGLDDIYHPFYWEDLDLGYKAWKAGWRILWEPKAKVVHPHGSTIKKYFDQKKINWVVKRNQILFFWLSISDSDLWLQHVLWLPYRAMFNDFGIPLVMAITRVFAVFRSRKERSKNWKLKDKEILALFERR